MAHTNRSANGRMAMGVSVDDEAVHSDTWPNQHHEAEIDRRCGGGATTLPPHLHGACNGLGSGLASSGEEDPRTRSQEEQNDSHSDPT